MLIKCRFCQAERKVIGVPGRRSKIVDVCEGCGSPVENARERSKRVKRLECPKCGSVSSTVTADNDLRCNDCSTVFAESLA